MKCSKCGADNDAEAEKCTRCGWGLRSQLRVEDQACANHPWRYAAGVCHACGIEVCESCEVFLDGVSYCKECAERPGEDELLREVKVVDPIQAEPAGFGLRLIAWAIDWLILFCAFSVLWTAFWLLFSDPTIPLDPGDHPIIHAAFWTIVGVSIVVYFIHSVAVNAQTPGMSAVDIAVVQDTGEIIGYRTAILRCMAMLPTVVSIAGIFCCIWDKHGRMLHDRLTHTRVIRMGTSV
jgi:uncharacterized RDD family membrane protein YckC